MSSKPSEANVKKLVAMGYTKSRATKALKECHNNVKSATSLLLKWQREAGEKEAKEALEKAKKQEQAEEAERQQRLKEQEQKAADSTASAAEWDGAGAGGIPNDPAILSATTMANGKAKQPRLADLNPRGSNPPAGKDKKTKFHPCIAKFGKCKYGANCMFRDVPSDVCTNYVMGSCVYGDTCRGTHRVEGVDAKVFFEKRQAIMTANGEGAMLNQPVVVATPDGLGQMVVDPNAKAGSKVYVGEQVEVVAATTSDVLPAEPQSSETQQSLPEASAWNGAASSTPTFTEPLAPTMRTDAPGTHTEPQLAQASPLVGGNLQHIQQPPQQHIPVFQQDITSAEDAAAPAPFLERLKMGLVEGAGESPEPSSRRGAEAALRQVAVNSKGQVMPPTTEAVPTFRSQKRHPCVVQHGSCHFGDHCHHAHLPGDVCVHWLNGHCRYEHGTCRFRHELPEGEDKLNYDIKPEGSQQPGASFGTTTPTFPSNGSVSRTEDGTPASHTNGFILSANPAATGAMSPGYSEQAMTSAPPPSQQPEQYWDSPQGMYGSATPPGMTQGSDYWRQQQQSSHPAALFQQQQSFAQQQRQQHYAAPGMPSAAAAQYYQEDHTHGGLIAANGGSPHPNMAGGFIPGFHHAGPLDHSGVNTPNGMDPYSNQMMGGHSMGGQEESSRSHSRYATPPSGIQSASPAGKGERLAPDGRPLCKYFQFGGCDRGDDCPFSHDLTIQAESHTEAQQGFVLSGNIGGNVRNLNKGKTPGSLGSPAPSF